MSTTEVSVLMTNDTPITPSNTSHTQYTLSRAEFFHGLANRLIYSRFYTWLYLGMALLSVVSIILSFTEECQSTGFIILEIIINTVMIAEVVTRIVALGKKYHAIWKVNHDVKKVCNFYKSRNATIDFSNVRESNPSMDFDSISNNAFLITDDDDDI
ncbi:8596_t:CDS:2 [Dentiscutata erythropus]|uniref:8596_t:CDS:1 n=1 Tax=Dentiscutata erythropus TaxID=1348616 RepID=A0A9N9HP08_9GLOM|nr:8596_t:CDS:2 [Dentiscutata erythropus]